jgi:P27 family predicted phage terminase small subunit
MPLERQKESMRGDGLRPGGHRPSKDLAIIPDQNYRVQRFQPPPPPADLRERGTAEWVKIWQAGSRWLHPEEDYHWIEQISHAYDDISAFREEIERTGLIVKGYAGQLTANPLLREIRDAENVIRKCLSVLGFSPTDRARLGLAEIKVQSGLQSLQNEIKDKRNGKT